MAQNFDQAKCDNTFWPTPNILGGSVSFVECGEYKKITEKLFKNFCSKVQIIKPFTSKKRWLEKTSKSVQFFAKLLYISLTGRLGDIFMVKKMIFWLVLGHLSIGAVYKRRRNCFGQFGYPPPSCRFSTRMYLTPTF